MLVTRRRFKLVATNVSDDIVGTWTLNAAAASASSSATPYEDADMKLYAPYVKENPTGFSVNTRTEALSNGGDNTYANNVFLESKHIARDQEIKFGYINGYILLRSNSQSSLLVSINSNLIEISRAGVKTDPNFFLNHYNYIYSNSDSTQISEWINTVGDGTNMWTVGCKGLDIYIKRNGVEIVKVQDFDIIHPGVIAITNRNFNYGGGLQDITVTNFVRQSSHSDTDNGIIDMRDFDWFRVNAKSTGSMDINDPYKLIVDDNAALQARVGDTITVAAGGEAPQYGRFGTTQGMICVGGGYPILWTDNETTLQAATDWPYETPIALRSTGEIWRNYGTNGLGGQCFRTLYTTEVGQQTNTENNYTIGYARGWDLNAVVTAINGNALTLSRPCQVSTTNAEVWVDLYHQFKPLSNGAHFGDLFGGDKTFKLPAGEIFTSGGITWIKRPNCKLIGAGNTLTKFVTPKGCAQYAILVSSESNNFVLKDFTIQGTYVESPTNETSWWGVPHYGPQTGSAGLDGTYTNYSNSATIGLGGIQMGNMTGGLIKNIHIENYHNGTLHMQQAHDSIAEDCSVNLYGNPKFYAAWSVGLDDGCSGCKISRMNFHSKYRLTALEFFGGNNNEISDCIVHNGMISSNSGENALILNNTFHFDRGVLPAWQVPNNPICNINGNNGRGVNSPAQVIGNSFYIHGADAYDNQTICINVQSGRDGCLIKGNYIQYLDVPASDAIGKFGIGIGTDSVDITIEDNTVIVPEAGWFVEGNPSNGCEIQINEGVSTGATIRRNTCHVIAAPINNPTICNITTTGPDANNVDLIYWFYGAQWRKP